MSTKLTMQQKRLLRIIENGKLMLWAFKGTAKELGEILAKERSVV